MPKYRSNPHRLHAVLTFSMRRLAAAYFVGTDKQVSRWLAAVEQTRRRLAASNVTSPLMASLVKV